MILARNKKNKHKTKSCHDGHVQKLGRARMTATHPFYSVFYSSVPSDFLMLDGRCVRPIYFVNGCPPCHLMIRHVFPTFFMTDSCFSATTHFLKTEAAMLEKRTYVTPAARQADIVLVAATGKVKLK